MSARRLKVVDSRPGAGLNTGGSTLTDRADYIRHLRRRGLSPNTIEKYGVHLRAFENWLARPLSGASPADIEVFLDTRRGRDSARMNDRSRSEWISHLSCFYAWSVRVNGRPVVNPCDAILRPKNRRLLLRPISEADLELAMFRADRRMYAWVVLGGFAGFRCCEIAWLRVESVMWHEGLVNVFGKGRKERIVEMHPLVVDALRSHGLPLAGPVFRWGDGRPYSPRNVSNMINDYFADLGINATAHQLRHRFGTKTYAACHDLRVTQELMGHSSPHTTQVYTAFARSEARAAVMALPVPPTSSEAA